MVGNVCLCMSIGTCFKCCGRTHFLTCDLQEDNSPQHQNLDSSVKPKWLLQRLCDYQRNDDWFNTTLCTKSQMNLKKKNLWSNCLTVTKNTCIHVQKLLIKSYFMLNITLEMVRAFGSVSSSFISYLAVFWQNLSLVWHF